MKRFDKLWIGILIGLIIPLIFGYFFVQTTYRGVLTNDELIQVVTHSSMIIKFLFIATLPNMFMVFILNTIELWRVCRGIFISIFLYMIACVPFIGN